MSQGKIYYLLADATAAKTGSPQQHSPSEKEESTKAVQAIITGTGAVSATIEIEGSNIKDSPAWIPIGTITISGTTAASNGGVHDYPWIFSRARLTAISGTNAVVSVNFSI